MGNLDIPNSSSTGIYLKDQEIGILKWKAHASNEGKMENVRLQVVKAEFRLTNIIELIQRNSGKGQLQQRKCELHCVMNEAL